MLRFGALDRRLNICTTASHMSSNCCALEHHSAVWKKEKKVKENVNVADEKHQKTTTSSAL